MKLRHAALLLSLCFSLAAALGAQTSETLPTLSSPVPAFGDGSMLTSQGSLAPEQVRVYAVPFVDRSADGLARIERLAQSRAERVLSGDPSPAQVQSLTLDVELPPGASPSGNLSSQRWCFGTMQARRSRCSMEATTAPGVQRGFKSSCGTRARGCCPTPFPTTTALARCRAGSHRRARSSRARRCGFRSCYNFTRCRGSRESID